MQHRENIGLIRTKTLKYTLRSTISMTSRQLAANHMQLRRGTVGRMVIVTLRTTQQYQWKNLQNLWQKQAILYE